MAFDFSDFEDEDVGDIPDGWTLVESNSNNDPSPYTRVVDTNTIEGDRSFRIGDSALGGGEAAEVSVGTEDIAYAGDYVFDTVRGDSSVVTNEVFADTNWWFVYLIDDDAETDFDIYYGTGPEPFRTTGDNSRSKYEAEGSKVGSLSEGFHQIKYTDPGSSLKLVVDDAVVHDTGTAFSGMTTLHFRADDAWVITDTSNQRRFSEFVFHAGSRVELERATQTYAFQRSLSEDDTSSLIHDDGLSPFVRVSGSAVGFEGE